MRTNINLLSICFSLELTRASPEPESYGESSPNWNTTLSENFVLMLDCTPFPNVGFPTIKAFEVQATKLFSYSRWPTNTSDYISNFNHPKAEWHMTKTSCPSSGVRIALYVRIHIILLFHPCSLPAFFVLCSSNKQEILCTCTVRPIESVWRVEK